MRSLKGKKILILGGTAPCVHVTQYAKEMGAFVYVADDKIEKEVRFALEIEPYPETYPDY